MIVDFEAIKMSNTERDNAHKILESYTDREIYLATMMLLNLKDTVEKTPPTRHLYAPAELARLWGCSYSYVYDNIRNKKIKAIKIGKTWRVSEQSKRAFEKQCEVNN